MKKYNHFWILTTILLVSCQTPQKENYRWLKKSLDAASIQLKIAGEKLEGTGMFPRSIHQVCDTMFISRQLERDPSIFKDSIESESTPELAVTYSRELFFKDYLDAAGIENYIPMRYEYVVRKERRLRKLVPAVHNLVFAEDD